MLKENVNTKVATEMNSGMMLKDTENMNFNFTGEFRDIIRHRDGRVEVKEGHNVIVKNIGKLIASLLKIQSGYTGLQYWAVGSGSDSWDNTNPPQATDKDTQLVNEIGRKSISASNMVYLDDSNQPTSSVTNKIRVTVTFGESDCNGVWREFALFGGNATTTRNSGLAINHKNHAIMVKTNTMTVERQIIFTFN